MLRGQKRRVIGVPHATIAKRFALLAALALGGCNTDGNPSPSASASRGASVAFESIDGVPPQVFGKLVQNLNEDAQGRRLAVSTREGTAAFRVRGYLAMRTQKGRSIVSWLWDVYDTEQQRALRISGEETLKGRHADAWNAVDDETLHKISRRSVDQLAAFLTSATGAPNEPQIQPSYAGNSPEASGIFRVGGAQADPTEADDESPASGRMAGVIPLPPRRPTALISAAQTVTLAAARQ